jgi:hypothetical protein
LSGRTTSLELVSADALTCLIAEVAAATPPRIGLVHLRRALLLFAIVLGLAAVAASVSRPGEDPEPPAVRSTPEPTVTPGPEEDESPGGGVELYFDAADPKAHRMRAGQAATVFVAVPRAGQVEIADLGISSTAEPLTAARFEVLTSQTGRFPITFVAAGGEEPARAGTLVVRE